MNDYENDLNKRTAKWMGLLIITALLFLTILMLVTSGCVTATKNTYANLMATPTPEPTPVPTTIEPTPEPTPTPIVTEDPRLFMLRTGGYHMRDWVHWFRPDVQGINGEGKKDLSTWVTVYGYKFMPSYHYWSVSWARKFLVKPDYPGDQFLFVFVNMYSDGDDVRQYGFDYQHFRLQIGDRIYNPDSFEYPERRITELDETWDYAHVETIKPYQYKIIQEKGSGIIRAERQEWLMGGRSNAHDGYIIFQVPYNVTYKDVRVLGDFANLGGNVWWQLDESKNINNIRNLGF